MSVVRTGVFQFRGADAPVVGEDLKVGSPAPEFSVHNNDWGTIQALESTRGKVRIIAAVPSLNTSVCDRETRRFNVEAASLGDDVAILVLSTDLPFTQKNWCGAAGVDRVLTLSDHMTGDFGAKYGVLLQNQRILRRAVFVVDRTDRVVYADYMPVLGEEPRYEDVLDAARKALAG